MKLYPYSLLLTLGLLSGCVAYTVSVKDGEALGANDGLVLVYANVRWVGTTREQNPTLELTYKPVGSTLDIRKIHFAKNETRQLIRVPAGDYVITHSFFGFKQLDFPVQVPFSVRPGRVSYLGHFEGVVTWPKIGLLSDRNLSLSSKRTEALRDLQQNFPSVRSSHELTDYAIERYMVKEL